MGEEEGAPPGSRELMCTRLPDAKFSEFTPWNWANTIPGALIFGELVYQHGKWRVTHGRRDTPVPIPDSTPFRGGVARPDSAIRPGGWSSLWAACPGPLRLSEGTLERGWGSTEAKELKDSKAEAWKGRQPGHRGQDTPPGRPAGSAKAGSHVPTACWETALHGTLGLCTSYEQDATCLFSCTVSPRRSVAHTAWTCPRRGRGRVFCLV